MANTQYYYFTEQPYTGYDPAIQDLAARFYYRPRNQEIAAKYADRFSRLDMIDIQQFGGWGAAQKTHFSDGGVFDQIYRPGGS